VKNNSSQSTSSAVSTAFFSTFLRAGRSSRKKIGFWYYNKHEEKKRQAWSLFRTTNRCVCFLCRSEFWEESMPGVFSESIVRLVVAARFSEIHMPGTNTRRARKRGVWRYFAWFLEHTPRKVYLIAAQKIQTFWPDQPTCDALQNIWPRVYVFFYPRATKKKQCPFTAGALDDLVIHVGLVWNGRSTFVKRYYLVSHGRERLVKTHGKQFEMCTGGFETEFKAKRMWNGRETDVDQTWGGRKSAENYVCWDARTRVKRLWNGRGRTSNPEKM